MKTPEYVTPTTLREALELLSGAGGGEAVVWAGGTGLGPLLRRGLASPAVLLGLEKVGELGGVQPADGGLRLGATVRLRDLQRSPVVAARVPALADAAGRVGNVRVRSLATLGGHLCHADPAQDLPPVLVALGARVCLVSLRGTRVLPLEEFFVGPLQTVLSPEELLTEVWVPGESASRNTVYARFAPRSPEDYPTVGVAVSVRLDPDGVCQEARVAVGGAGPTVLRITAAEQALVGGVLAGQRIRDAAREVEAAVDPWDDSRGSAEYKRAMARVWTERVLQKLADEV
ncbi:MAG: xanthine dehydrogenase family protein subunit M [Armatimonadota bacterium]|nr:xanthine dehydrogenase family protein subunit M [Armatimonadota bacterium]MDW8156147.1 xanthine dehydrogenase family protein subunit M [Armatimonadota bacterium]